MYDILYALQDLVLPLVLLAMLIITINLGKALPTEKKKEYKGVLRMK